MHGADEYAYGMWVVTAFNVGLFLFFILSFLKPRGREEWRSMGVVEHDMMLPHRTLLRE